MRARIIIIAALLCARMAEPFSPWGRELGALLGDARLGNRFTAEPSEHFVTWRFSPPSDTHEWTLAGWQRATPTNSAVTYTFPLVSYAPADVQRFNPDLASNVFGHAWSGGTNVNGTVTVTPFAWKPYTDVVLSNKWPRGVYTVDGWASNAVTVSVGGEVVVFAAGRIHRNVVPGVGAGVSVATTGLVSIGISRTPGTQFFEANGAADFDTSTGVSAGVARMISSTGWHFFAARARLDETSHVWCVGARAGFIPATNACLSGSNAMPADGTRLFYRSGEYRVFFPGAQNIPDKYERLFDVRVQPRWLTDEELDRVFENGRMEIERRGMR